ncbi:hypothetical protein BgAZ_303740 [Babesia gibsoni]|uniref:Uncharacterized protein n=1 Tax=Babesia gibsoni TaxID=33632 RepID=A0AAD8LQ73_BABGI|nr:hypothetical protein BgAZ_303740 [Babesia gibsoni]
MDKVMKGWSEAFFHISSFMIGVAVGLIYAFSSSDMYFLMRYMGTFPLEAQGLYYFLRRVSYASSILVILLMIFTSVNKLIVCIIHWTLTLTYMIVYLYLTSTYVFLESSRFAQSLFVISHLLSTALQTGFFFVAFDVDVPGGRSSSSRSVLYYLFGCGLSGSMIKWLINIHIGSESETVCNFMIFDRLFKRIAAANCGVTFLSSTLYTYAAFYLCDGPCRQYLTLTPWNVMCMPFNRKLLIAILSFSLGWVITPICGILTSTLLLNVTVIDSLKLDFLQQSLYLFCTLMALMILICYILQLRDKKRVDIGGITKDIGEQVIKEEPESSKNMKTHDERDALTTQIGRRVLPDVQPWCMLPLGFWSKWEESDNDFSLYMQQCLSVYTLVQSVVGGRMPKSDCIGAARRGGATTYNDMKAAKYRLLGLLSQYTEMCNNLYMTLQNGSYHYQCSKCPYQTMRVKMCAFVTGRACVCIEWSTWDCAYAICAGEAVMKGICCQLCGKLLACVECAISTICCIRKDCDLRDDHDDTKIYEAAHILEKHFMKLLLLLYYYQMMLDWVTLCEYMWEIQFRFILAIIEFGPKCCVIPTCGEAVTIEGNCGCRTLIKLAQCCELLHRRQCELLASASNITSSSVSTLMPSSSHTRCLMLLVTYFTKIHCSGLACDRADRTCCNTQKGCRCCRYSERVDLLISRWLSDVMTSMSCGAALLKETIDIVSYVVSDSGETGTTPSRTNSLLSSLMTMLGLSRTSSEYVSLMYTSNILTIVKSFTSNGSTDNGDNVQDTEVANFCCLGKDCKNCNCTCLTKECGKCQEVENNTIVALQRLACTLSKCNLDSLCTTLEKAKKALTESCDKFAGLCSVNLNNAVCIEQLGCEVKKLFCGLLQCSSTSTSSSSSTCKCEEGKCCCKIPCVNRDLVRFLLYPCDTKSEDRSCTIICKCQCPEEKQEEAAAICEQKCEQENCKSLCCIVKKFAETLFCKNAKDCEKCCCAATEEKSDSTACGECNALKCIFVECCKTLCGLENKLCCSNCTSASGEKTGATCGSCSPSCEGSEKSACCTTSCPLTASCSATTTTCNCACDATEKTTSDGQCLSKSVKCFECILAKISEIACELDQALSCLCYSYTSYLACLSLVERSIQCKIDVEMKAICDLKTYLDRNGCIYSALFAAATTVTNSISSLADQQQYDISTLDCQVRHLSHYCNQLSSRAEKVEDENIKCVEGLDAEKKSIAASAKSKHSFLENLLRRKNWGVLDLVNTYMWYFDCVWFVILVTFYFEDDYSTSRGDWIYLAHKIMSVWFVIKGALMTFSYITALSSVKKCQPYLINIAMVLGLIMAVIISWLCQLYTYNTFLKEHSISIWKQFRILYPTSLEKESVLFRWYNGLYSLITADVSYLKRFLKRRESTSSTYNPFSITLDTLFRYTSRSVRFNGVCDWGSYEEGLLRDISKKCSYGKFKKMLDYLAFKALTPSSLSFLSTSTVLDGENIPTDLLWVAWSKKQVLTLQHCMLYSMFEMAYESVLQTAKSTIYTDSEVENKFTDGIDSFSLEQQKNIAKRAMNLNDLSLEGLTMKSLGDLYDQMEKDYRDHLKWYIMQYTPISTPAEYVGNTYVVPSGGNAALQEPSWLFDLPLATLNWRSANLKECDRVYGGSSECKNVVNATADKISNCIQICGEIPNFHGFMHSCLSLFAAEITDDNVYGYLEAENDGESVVVLSEPYGYTEVIDEIEARRNSERMGLHLYFLGEWLRRMDVPLTTLDVNNIIDLTLSRCRLD